jgi:hypothetical protein
MQFIISIDVGVKNLGICVFDCVSDSVCYWSSESLVTSGGRYMPSRNVEYVHAFVTRHARYFENAKCVLVERQMRCNMRIIESVMHSMHYDRCIILSPRHVKVHFGLSRNNYRLNKQAAVQWMQEFVALSPEAFSEGVSSTALAKHASKQDDLADALLMVMYYIYTYDSPKII